MYIKNATYKTVPTGSLSFPLAEGAVVTAGGVTGIVPENLAAAGPTAQIYVAVGGTIDLTSEANKGVSFTDAQIKALGSDFNFVPASEKELPTPTLADAGKVVAVNETGTEYELVESGGGGLPEYTAADAGKALCLEETDGTVAPVWQKPSGALICNTSFDDISDNYVLDKTVQEIYDALLSGTPAYIKFQYGTLDDYTGTLYLAPVVKIYNYDNTNVIRIVAAKPVIETVQNTSDLAVPGCLIYSANGLNDYPAAIRSTMVKTESCSTIGVR